MAEKFPTSTSHSYDSVWDNHELTSQLVTGEKNIEEVKPFSEPILQNGEIINA